MQMEVPSIRMPVPTREPVRQDSLNSVGSSASSSPSLDGSSYGSAGSRSRSSSPLPLGIQTVQTVPAGLMPDATYRRLLSPWRYSMRARLVRSLEREMHILPKIQSACRTARLDRLMVYSSWLGSHTFFMIFLPLCFWFGFPRFGIPAVYILAAGVYFSGCLKDYMCVPRPYAPPVVRLSIGNHAAEYGFPSTHSATSIGSALFIMQQIWPTGGDPAVLHAATVGAVSILVMVYIVMLVFGRLYCGMHSLIDVFTGSAMGVVIWVANALVTPFIYAWITADRPTPDYLVPSSTILLGLFLISAHAQPVDDCPCFEDSTAFIAVAMGVTIGVWAENTFVGPQRTPIYQSDDVSSNVRLALFALSGVLRIAIGLAGIFSWRIVAKSVLQKTLPPIYRLIVPLFNLPRRHYVPATDYDQYNKETDPTIVPSVVDLPRLAAENRHTTALHPSLQNRKPGSLAVDPLIRRKDRKKTAEAAEPAPAEPQDADVPFHHDVDVLIRTIVYGGIGLLAA